MTLIERPAAAVPLVQVAAVPTLDDPRQRARYTWEAFSSAMRELTTGADGWCVLGAAERVTPLPYLPAGAFMRVGAIHCVTEYYSRNRQPMIIERHEELDLGGPGVEMDTHWRCDHG